MASHLLPSISFAAQPNLKLLFETLADPDDERPITIICGAGVSRSAELPDWRQLIDRMCDFVEPPELGQVLRGDPVDLMRKADYILRVATTSRTAGEVIRDALYRGLTGQAKPGPLADSVARLTKNFPGRVRLITTNFDNQLELALERYFRPHSSIRSFGLQQFDDWDKHSKRRTAPSVLHVHGMVVPGLDPISPLVLSESFFLKYGPLVRDIISDALRTSHVLFVGVSMADPNLISPLSEVQKERDTFNTKAFLLVVPDLVDGVEDQHVRDHADRSAAYLSDAFGLHPVVLKAYSEVPQVLYDIVLASRDPGTYFSNDRGSSLRYGHRLTRALASAYKQVGAPAGEDCISGSQQAALSDVLYRELYRRGGQKRAGPGTLLKGWLKKDIHSDWLEDHGLNHKFMEQEEFALFLWLRSRSRRPNAHETPPFSIRLLGTSAYTHRESWSLRRELPIRSGISFVSDAAYFGSSHFRALDDAREFPLWRAVVTCPIRWEGEGSGEEVFGVGVITLNTNRSIAGLEDIRRCAQDERDVEKIMNPSVISFLDTEQRDSLVVSLQRAALNSISQASQRN